MIFNYIYNMCTIIYDYINTPNLNYNNDYDYDIKMDFYAEIFSEA
jgi:hypothetical protein